MIDARRGMIVAVALLFLWRQEAMDAIRGLAATPSPPAPAVGPLVPVSPAAQAWASALKASAIQQEDRLYYSDFYAALRDVLSRDGEHDAPALDTTEKIRRAHSAALDMALERAKVGRYPGLGEAIDRALALAAAGASAEDCADEDKVAKAIEEGLTPRPVTKALRSRLIEACGALAAKFAAGGD